MANSSFWGRKDKVISATLQGCVEAGHSQISVAHSGSEQWGGSCAGAEGRGWGRCAVSDSPNSPSPQTLRLERVATGCRQTCAYSEPPGWALFLSAPPEIGRS